MSLWTRHRFWFRYLRYIKRKGTSSLVTSGENNHNSDLYRSGSLKDGENGSYFQNGNAWRTPVKRSPNSVDLELSSENVSTPTVIHVTPWHGKESVMTSNIDDVKDTEFEEDSFLTPFDTEVLDSMGSFNNRPLELLRISTPALLSLALCPATLYLYRPFATLFWPNFAVPPDINEAIACFLAPAGLVYATSFGFAFQQALSKQREVLQKVSHELGLIDQVVTLTSKISLPSLKHRMDIYRAIKAEAIFMVLQVQNREPSSFINKPTVDIKGKLF